MSAETTDEHVDRTVESVAAFVAPRSAVSS
jgi:hypothetical protein